MEGIITKRLIHLEGKDSGTICLVIAVYKRKWCIDFSYRPPDNSLNHISKLDLLFNIPYEVFAILP